ncbi:hypothetical protein AAEX28_02425 [Lentisphaerota bacterium WC36G]|nr:hypothetical protein LJT99_05310 [Lentisphaerae bacterium WC36]
MKKLLIISSCLIFITGCKNNIYTEVEYYENGAKKREVNRSERGAIDWSNGKELTIFKAGT